MQSLSASEFRAAKEGFDALPESQKIESVFWRFRGFVTEQNITASDLELLYDLAISAFAALRHHGKLPNPEQPHKEAA